MTTYTHPGRGSVSQPGNGAPSTLNAPDDDSRRNSISANGNAPQSQMTMGEALGTHVAADKDAREANADPVTAQKMQMANPTAMPATIVPPVKKTWNERHAVQYDEENGGKKRFWTRGRKKICCGICIFLLAVIVTLAIVVAFLVRTPSVSYDSVTPVCANNDYLYCAQNTLELVVYLDVDNPNIIGCTINADLILYKEDGTTELGPGTVSDVYVGSRTTTQIVATFNITSSRAYDILEALYIPPTRAYTVKVTGTIYAHVGSLRPSINIDETFSIPAQNAGSAASQIAGALGATSLTFPTSVPTDPATVAGDLSGLGVVPDSTASTVSTAQGDIGSAVTTGEGVASTVSGAASTVSGVLGKLSVHHINMLSRAAVRSRSDRADPVRMTRALRKMGAPGSNQRRAFDSQRAQREAAKKRSRKLYLLHKATKAAAQ